MSISHKQQLILIEHYSLVIISFHTNTNALHYMNCITCHYLPCIKLVFLSPFFIPTHPHVAKIVFTDYFHLHHDLSVFR